MLLKNALILTAIWYVLMPSPAYAYFDLNFTTYIIQMLLGVAAAGWLMFKDSWRKFIVNPFKKDKNKKIEPPAEASTEPATEAQKVPPENED